MLLGSYDYLVLSGPLHLSITIASGLARGHLEASLGVDGQSLELGI